MLLFFIEKGAAPANLYLSPLVGRVRFVKETGASGWGQKARSSMVGGGGSQPRPYNFDAPPLSDGVRAARPGSRDLCP